MNIIVSSKSKHRFSAVAVLIVILAIGITVYEVTKATSSAPKIDFRDSNHQFNNLKFINKAKVSFSTPDPAKAQDEIARIMDEKGKRRIRKEDGGSYGAYIFTVGNETISEIVGSLREIGTIGTTVELIDTALVNLDFDSESAKLKSYESELSDLGKVRFPSDIQNKRKEELHALIQYARNNLEKLRENDITLLYITLSSGGSAKKGLNLIMDYFIVFLKWLAILFLLRILLVIIANLLVDLFNLVGIKPNSDQGFGSYSGYYTRYSNRGESKRKIKRVYKDRDIKPENSEDNNK